MGHFHNDLTIIQYYSEYSETCIRQSTGIQRNCKYFLIHISVNYQKGEDKAKQYRATSNNHESRSQTFSTPFNFKFCLKKMSLQSKTITAPLMLSSNS